MGDILSRFSVKKKIMVLISVLFVVVMLVLGVVLDRVITKSQMESFEEETTLQAIQVDASMDLFLRGLRDSVVNMANDPILRNGGNITVYIDGAAGADGMIAMDPQAKGGFELQAYQLFQRLAESHKESISVVSYGTTDGGYLQYPAVKRKKGYDSRKRSWFKDSMADVNAVRITKPFKTSKGTPTVGIFATVKSMSGQPLGVLGINIDLPVVTNMISEIKIGETGYIMMLDSDNVIIADPKHPDANFKKLAESELGDIASLDTNAKGLKEISLDGTSKIVNVYSSNETGYKYVTVVDKSQLMADVNNMRKILVVVLVVALVLIFFATMWISNIIVAPLRGLEASAERIAKGDLRQEDLQIESDDEIGHLAESFNQMTKQLKNLLSKIKGSSDEVFNSSAQMSQGVEQVAQTITHVAESVGDIAESATKQNETMNGMVDNIRDMADQVTNIATSSEEISKSSGKAGQAALDGVNAIESAVEQIRDVFNTVNDSAKAVGELGRRSEEIGEIVGTIKSIAEQTNLLALNAAIEAARAGEQGRGFSVVADEVRKLAEQSAEAAQEIAEKIGGVQQVTVQAVESMTAGTEKVRVGSEAVEDAGKQFKLIADHIRIVDDMVKESAVNATKVAEKSKGVLTDAEDVERSTKKVTENITSISAATEEQSASMEEIAASSHHLSSMAEDLQKESSRFRF